MTDELGRRDLSGKVAVVVGAGPGVGRACALAFARDGADVVVSARRSEPLVDLAAEIAARDRVAAWSRSCPTSPIPTPSQNLVDQAVERLGGVDALVTVATAGGGQIAIDDADWAVWRHAFEVNVIGTMEVSRCAARSMASRGGGSIVHVSSFSTHSIPARHAAYTATKSAAVTASKTMAKELGPQGTRVNVVTPGYITGGPLDETFQLVAGRTGESTDAVSARMARTAALRRHVDPEDIAEAVLFLCSERGRGVTGVEVPVTAGQHPL